ncbi:MAG: hypothetical protein KAX18_11170, partial [Candidatus Lokiarchaeota archaeon]|nr:hypothetical protein [Candidatus Lokiarchaeota archaeon]
KNFSKQPYKISLDKQDWIESLKDSQIQLEVDISDHLYQQYGKGALKVLEIIREDETLKQKIIEENNFIKAEIIYCLRNELTPHLIDVFCRRTEMSHWISYKRASLAAKEVAELMAREYSWVDAKKEEEIGVYLDYIKKSVSFIK